MPVPRADENRLRAMGDRILFGSDFPNIPYSYVDAIRTMTDLPGIDDAWLRNVLHDNAARLFGLT
jgi:predicted TIM-barrel fold metal-dependent hydrolase